MKIRGTIPKYYILQITTRGIEAEPILFKTKDRIVKYINNHLESHYLEYHDIKYYNEGYFRLITQGKKKWTQKIKGTETIINMTEITEWRPTNKKLNT